MMNKWIQQTKKLQNELVGEYGEAGARIYDKLLYSNYSVDFLIEWLDRILEEEKDTPEWSRYSD